MADIYLMPYYVHARLKRHKDFLPLGEIPGGHQLSALFNAYLSSRKTEILHDDQAQRLLSVVTTKVDDGMTSGTLRTGLYGYESDFIDIETQQIAYQRKTTHAEMLPFYFVGCFPDKSNTGLLLIERFGVNSAKGTLVKDFQAYLDGCTPSSSSKVMLDFEPVVPAETARHWIEEGRVFKIRLIRNSAPSDLADEVQQKNLPMPQIGEAELWWKVERNQAFPPQWVQRLLRVLDGSLSVGEVLELQSFEPDRIKVELAVDGKQRTIDLVDSTKVRAWYDVSNQVDRGNDGHPTFGSIDAVARQIVRQLQQ